MKTLAANKTVIANAVTEEVTMINNTVETAPMKDLTLDFTTFFSTTGTLGASTNASLNEARAALAEKHGYEVAERAQKALSVITIHGMLNTVGGKDHWLGSKLFEMGVEYTQWWSAIVKDESVSHGRRYFNALETVVGKGHPSIALFKSAIACFKDHSVEHGEDGITRIFHTKRVNNKTEQIGVFKEYPTSPVKVSLQRNTIKVLVKKDTTITPVRGQKFVFTKHTAATFGVDVINQHLEGVLSGIRIHNEYVRITDKDLYQHEVKSYTKEAYKFNKEDILVLLLLLKENNIDIKDLVKNAKEAKGKVLVLAREENTSKVKSLHRIVAPAFAFPEKYAMSGVTSLNDAKQGYIVPMVTLPRLVEFTKDDKGIDQVVTRENVNKTINRFDKLDNAKALWKHSVKVFVVSDATTDEEINKALVGGDILVPDSFLLSNGVCRVVTDMDNGGIKASTVPFQKLDKQLAKGDICVISSAGYKGGLLSALGQAYGNVGLVENLFNIVDKEEDHDVILNNMRKAVLNQMTTMIINGKEVQGVMITVELSITNAYTVDSLRLVNTEVQENSETAQKEVKESIEQLLEEIDTESKQSKGLRAYVAQQKAGSSDLFSVQEWMKDGLRNGTLERKPLVTKVISQEIQSIAHWYGKPTAVAFLQDLLNNQEENGFRVEKLYALQYIGAIEKEKVTTISVQEVVDVLLASKFKVQEDSSVYTKDTMSELLELFGNTVYGWTELVYPNGNVVDIPLGRVFTADIEEQMENDKSYVVAKGLINDVLENIKGMIKEDGSLFTESGSSAILEALVQKPLLGKNFGYQHTKGYYGVALPMLGNYAVTTAGITNRDRMVKSDDTWVGMTLSKAPQYFEGMTSTYDVVDLDFGADLNMVLECAVFVNVEIVLMHQNDFDGDQYRITIGNTLPYVKTIYDNFNGKFFESFYQNELAGNKLDIKPAQIVTLSEYHEAVRNAIQAKDHIGSYTANSYYYEATLPNLIGKTIELVNGKEVEVTFEAASNINALLKMLIQMEAMDNVKQEGSNDFITDLVLHYKLRNLKGYNGTSDEKAISNHLNKCVKAISALVLAKDIDLTDEQIVNYVGIMFYTARNFNSKATTALNLFNARNVNEKALQQALLCATGEEYEDTYNFKNSYESIINGIDTESMYFEIITMTVEALSGDDIAIRV